MGFSGSLLTQAITYVHVQSKQARTCISRVKAGSQYDAGHCVASRQF